MAPRQGAGVYAHSLALHPETQVARSPSSGVPDWSKLRRARVRIDIWHRRRIKLSAQRSQRRASKLQLISSGWRWELCNTAAARFSFLLEALSIRPCGIKSIGLCVHYRHHSVQCGRLAGHRGGLLFPHRLANVECPDCPFLRSLARSIPACRS